MKFEITAIDYGDKNEIVSIEAFIMDETLTDQLLRRFLHDKAKMVKIRVPFTQEELYWTLK